MTRMAWKILNLTAKNESGASAEILLYDEIGDWWGKSAKDFISEIKALGDVREITLRINSAGGDVFDASAMYSYLKTHKANKTVRIDGLAASAASFLAMVGDKVIMPKNAFMMIHNPWTIEWGESEDLRKAADFLDKVRDIIASVYISKTGLDHEKIKSMMDDETWLDAEEAFSLGFCDETDEPIEIAAQALSLSEGDISWKTAAGTAQFSRNLAAKMPKAAKEVPLVITTDKTSAANPQNAIKVKEEKILDIKNVTELEAAYPEFVKEIRSAEAETGMKAGAQAERERLKALDGLAGPGRDAILAKAKYEEPKDARDVAMELLKASADIKALNDRKTDADEITPVLQPTDGGPTDKEKEEDIINKIADTINKNRGYKS